MNDSQNDMERVVREALGRIVFKGDAPHLTMDALTPVVVALIEAQRAPLIEKLNDPYRSASADAFATMRYRAEDAERRAERAEASILALTEIPHAYVEKHPNWCAICNGGTGVPAHLAAEAAVERIRVLCDELEADIPYDAGNDHANHIGRVIRAALDGENNP